ncbi:uncharacterized protein TNCV_2989651 [Trichonephila clavipes]|nr:uncharacterized protein TNCV_2989651 [Trichonephila clavipes]
MHRSTTRWVFNGTVLELVTCQARSDTLTTRLPQPPWASTVHKKQGSTVAYAIIYLGRKLFAEGQAHVTSSREKSLDGQLIEELDSSKFTEKIPCNNKALQEMDRIKNNVPSHHLHKLKTK